LIRKSFTDQDDPQKEKMQGHLWDYERLLGAPAIMLDAPSNNLRLVG